MREVSLIIIIYNDKFLLFKRSNKNHTHQNQYGFVGGGIENNETDEQAAIREAKEEINLNLSNLTKLKNYTFEGSNLHVFYAKINDISNIKLNPEHTDYKLFTLDEIKNNPEVISTTAKMIQDYLDKTNIIKELYGSFDGNDDILSDEDDAFDNVKYNGTNVDMSTPVMDESSTDRYTSDDNVGGSKYPAYNVEHENDDENNYSNDEISERRTIWIPGSKAVNVKQKCRLGGGTICNQGDMNNLEFNKLSLKEEVDGFEARNNIKMIDSVFNGSKSVGTIVLTPEYKELILKYKLNLIKITPSMSEFYIVYKNDVRKAMILFQYLKEHNGLLNDKTPEEAWKIGKLLDYSDESIKKYIKDTYGDKLDINEEIKNNKMNLLKEVELMSLQDLPFKQEIDKNGGAIFSVGGAVRDEFLGKESKDLDILITGIPMDQLEQILSKYGRVDAVGKSFGVLKFKPVGSTEDIDVAIPRTEKPTGDGGHKGFEVSSDHSLPIEADLKRRDFTINAIAKDIDGNLIDPFGGQNDLKNKIIRVVNPDAFSEDPLRMMRGIQFSSRFGFSIEPNTMKMIQDNASRIREIPADRILTELKKIVDKGNKRIGAQLLKDSKIYNNIFGTDLKQTTIDRSPFEDVKTMGEYMFLLMRLLSNPADFFKNNLRGDNDSYNEIRAYELAFNSNVKNIAEARGIAHNMYKISPYSIQSNILPNEIKNGCNDLLSGKYPKNTTELAINGNELMQLGLKGKEIGDTQKSLLIRIYADKIKNTRDDILSALGKNDEIEEGVGDKYLKNKYNIPDSEDDFEREYQADLQKNKEIPYGFIIAKKSYSDNVVSKIPVYKNPKSLANFDNGVRGIVDINGNIYVAVYDGNFNHGEMAQNIGLFNNSTAIYDKLNIYVLLNRINNQKSFGLSDFSEDAAYNYGQSIIEMLQKAKKNNPQYDFYPVYFTNVRANTRPITDSMKKINKQETTDMDESLQSDLKAFRAEKELQNQLKPSILPRDEKGNYIMKDIQYSAVVLLDNSKNKLIEQLKIQIPEGWTVYADHMTICMGKLPPDLQSDTGLTKQLRVETFAMDDKVMAVGVTGYPTKNEHPHITIAVNRANGGAPKMSNDLNNWSNTLPDGQPLKRFYVSGKVTEIPYKLRK